MLKILISIFALVALVFCVSIDKVSGSMKSQDWCSESEPYFLDHCPVALDDLNGCCLCTRSIYFSCDCCTDVFNTVGMGGNCSAYGQPSPDGDKFCDL